MKAQELRSGTVVQLNPETVGNKSFAACFMVVTESRTWGCKGYITSIGEGEPGGLAYYRANWEEMELVGYAEWIAK
jgi:hypothetical protein